MVDSCHELEEVCPLKGRQLGESVDWVKSEALENGVVTLDWLGAVVALLVLGHEPVEELVLLGSLAHEGFIGSLAAALDGAAPGL